MKRFIFLPALLATLSAGLGAEPLQLVRIGNPVGGHIHPAACVSAKGTLVVTYGHVNHRDLRITRSTDGGATWSEPKPFPRDEKVVSNIRHPIVELAANQWLLPLGDKTQVFDPTTGASQPFGDGRAHGLVPIVRTLKGTFVSGAGLRSTDAGKTWQPIQNFPNLKEQGWRHEMVCLANGWLLASEILGPGVGGERIRYVLSRDDGVTWGEVFEYYNPGRAIGGRACPRTVELGGGKLGVVFYDAEPKQAGGPGLFFLKLSLDKMSRAAQPRSAD